MHSRPEWDIALDRFIEAQRLPQSYRGTCEQWFFPLAERIAQRLNEGSDRPLIIGINGAQGSGKSTLAELLVWLFNSINEPAVTLSIDDFYHTAAERYHLGDVIHPLLRTRGVPGTHDIALAHRILNDLQGESGTATIPRFNKANDDRAPASEWPEVKLPVALIILEGWCLGTTPQRETELLAPVNTLEDYEDHDAQWRTFSNQQLDEVYRPLFQRIDYWVMLQAPSFDCVYQWRQEQEARLAETTQGDKIMDAQQLQRFIQHYERLTRHTLKHLPEHVHELFELDDTRQITAHINHQDL